MFETRSSEKTKKGVESEGADDGDASGSGKVPCVAVGIAAIELTSGQLVYDTFTDGPLRQVTQVVCDVHV